MVLTIVHDVIEIKVGYRNKIMIIPNEFVDDRALGLNRAVQLRGNLQFPWIDKGLAIDQDVVVEIIFLVFILMCQMGSMMQ